MFCILMKELKKVRKKTCFIKAMSFKEVTENFRFLKKFLTFFENVYIFIYMCVCVCVDVCVSVLSL